MTLQSISSILSNSLFLALVVGIPIFGMLRRVKVYESFIEGAKDGFPIIVKIIPFMVAMLVAIGMFRASGGFELLGHALSPILTKIGMPAEILPLALIRPFSGSAANGVLADIIHHNGGNSYVSHLAGTIMGSTETTFYVIAVYFGAVSVRRTRHAIPAGLVADTVAVIAALWICHVLLK
ncbi:spore maturation protein [soil metagenome]